jgi:hypothetical protein
VGRNEPCPCGSGKKFKSAAGRHLSCTDRISPGTEDRHPEAADRVLDFACGWGSLLLSGRRQVGKIGGGCLAEVDSDSLHNNVIYRQCRRCASALE